MNKGLVFILDGLGDRPCPQLGGKTPLEAAPTPTLDQLARASQCGMMDPLLPGMPVDTHTGVGILFGLAPREAVGLRRGPIEAAGIGLQTQAGDVLLRANFACVERTSSAHATAYHIIDRRAGRIRDVEALCAALQAIEAGPGITASLHAATQHRAVLRLRGANLSAQVSDTDPGGDGVNAGILAATPKRGFEAEARATADAINHFTDLAHDILDRHALNAARVKQGQSAANGVLLRSAGVRQRMNNLLSSLDLKVAAVAGEKTILGLAKLFAFDGCTSDAFTSLPDTDLAGKLRMASAVLKTHDLVFVHIKGTDTAAHDKNPALKAEVIARFDRELGACYCSGGLDNIIIGLCADHSTDSASGEHSGDPVPVLIRNPHGRLDRVIAYNETDCVPGALGRITAQGFLTTLLDAMGAFGSHKPEDLDYYRF